MPNDQEGISVLKTIWKRDAAGTWSVHDVQTLKLKPRKGESANYFKIATDFDLLTQHPGAIFDNLFATFGSTEFLVQQSVVPVVAWNEGDAEMRCIGTGFFISASGLLITAAHVLRDPIDEGYSSQTPIAKATYRLGDALHFGIMLPVNPAMRNAPFAIQPELRNAKSIICPFEWAEYWGKAVESPLFHEKPKFQYDIDIAICKVRENPIGGSYQPLNIGRHSLAIGDRAVAVGYAEMKNIPMNSNRGECPELVVSVGNVKNIYANNLMDRQASTPGPCFDFDAKVPGKMSGGPILVGPGILAKGVVSRGWQDDNYGSGCLIAPIMGLDLSTLKKSISQLMTTGNEGIAHFQSGGI